MERTLINNLHEHIDREVTIAGWVDVRRDHGKLIFLDIRDRSGRVQCVALPDREEAQKVADTVRAEWVVEVSGTVSKRPEKMVNPDEANGDIELAISSMEVLASAAELPFDIDEDIHIDTHLDNLPLTLRTERNRAIFSVQSAIIRAYREYLRQAEYTEIQAPKIVGDDAEGGGNVFAVEYFREKTAYLATSPQLYKQIMVGVFERVFATGNVFRAEKHSTTRHINEYTSLDAELGFITDYTDVMQELESLMRHVVDSTAGTCAKAFAAIGADVPLVPSEPFPRMKMRDAQMLIKENTDRDPTDEPDLAPEDERWLCDYARNEFGSDFIFITHYPTQKRPFYTYRDPEDPEHTWSFDLLFRGVEIATGGQRVHAYEEYLERLQEKGLDPKPFAFYLQAFKYGMPPHGGWGMGLERLTQKMLQLESVKEATLFPREINRIDTLLHTREE